MVNQTNDVVTIHSTNLYMALRDTIQRQQEAERDAGYTSDSVYLAGLKSVLNALKDGRRVVVIGSTLD